MNRRLLFGIVLVLLFSIIVIIWYFLYVTPKKAPSLGLPNNPLSSNPPPRFFQFITEGEKDTESQPTSTTEVTPATLEALTQIWNKPTSGQTFVSREIFKEIDVPLKNSTSTIKKTVRATSTVLMFVDRLTGYVYGYQIDDGKLYQISNTTIPGIHDAYIFENGKRLVLRYPDPDKHTIVSIIANIPGTQPSSSPLQLEKIQYLPSQVSSLSINKKGDKLSYLVSGNDGSSIYTTSSKGPLLVASSPFREWYITYGGETLYATSKPSAYIEGSTVKLPSFEYILGEKTGLMSNPSPKGTLLNSMWSSRGLVSFISLQEKQIILSINTLASKCVWGQKEYLLCAVPKSLPKNTEGLPDDWFQGRFFFEDSLNVVDPISGTSYPLYSFTDYSEKLFDVIQPILSSDNSLISFLRKQDQSLWLLRTNLIKVD